MAFSLTPKQVEANRLLASAATNIMLRGGSRSGKTFLIIRAICIRAMKAANSKHAVFRFRFNHAKASIWKDTLPKVMRLCFPEVPLDLNETDLVATFPNGSQVILGGLDDKARVEKILGGEYSTIYFNESSQIPWSSVEVAMSRLAENSGLALKAYFDCNPPSKLHWSYQLFRLKMKPGTKEAVSDPDDYVEMLVNPSDNKDNLPPKYFDILGGMSAAQRLRFERGEWASEVNGALWSLEDKEAHDGRIIPGIDSVRIAHGTAPRLQRVVVAVDPSGTKGDGGGDDIGIVVAGKGVDGRAYDCALFMWIVGAHLLEAIDLAAAWGFAYKTDAFIWTKPRGDTPDLFRQQHSMGMGYWTRKEAETCLLFTRGRPKRIGKGVRQIIEAPRREHSRKPDETHARIQALVAGPYLEMFARAPRPGWTVWGNETAKFGDAA